LKSFKANLINTQNSNQQMSQHLITYIQSLADTSFEAVKTCLTEKGFRIHDEGPLYMVCGGTSTDVFSIGAVGTILNKETHELVCYGFPKTIDMESTDNVPFSGKIVLSEYIDGSLIRAFYDGTSWRLSTNNVINAYNSYWISEESFGQLFDNCLGDSSNFSTSFLAGSLDKDCSYQFIVCHPKVHLDGVTNPTIYHAGTYCVKTHSYVDRSVTGDITKPKSEVIQISDETSCGSLLLLSTFSKGYIMYSVDDEKTQSPRFKVLSPEYSARRKLLGNTPNLYLRYLECLADGTAGEFKSSFPNLGSYSDTVETCLDRITKDVFDIYVHKFMKKNKGAFINFYLRPFVYELHGNFMKTQKKVTVEIVKETFMKYHPKRINFILNGLGMITTNDVVLPKIEEKVVSVA
jgi:hypothetical protein